MKTETLINCIVAVLIAAGVVFVSLMINLAIQPTKAADMPRIRWTDSEGRQWIKNKWDEHCARYGPMSNSVIFPYRLNIETNAGVAMFSDGSLIELGFRDDGVVVWRKK